jgi:DNA-binding MarR family transcriptional regulator
MDQNANTAESTALMSTEEGLPKLETELAALARMLEGMSRRTAIHREIDRSSYLIARMLAGEGATSIGGVAERLGLDATTVTRQVATMESAGLVVRRTDANDGRVRLIKLTSLGARTMREVRQTRENRIAELVADWSTTDVDRFGELLGRFNRSLRDHRPAD